jgi:hypothetical protein
LRARPDRGGSGDCRNSPLHIKIDTVGPLDGSGQDADDGEILVADNVMKGVLNDPKRPRGSL